MATLSVDHLTDGWRLYKTDPGTVDTPEDLHTTADYHDVPVPGTVAQAAIGANADPFSCPFDPDAFDWWYQTEFAASPDGHYRLNFEGLATLAEVWLNGEKILDSKNMFRRYSVDLAEILQPNNRLCLVFRALDAALQLRRPRPRWKTNLVKHQQLRWFRTTLLGRCPGWSPPVPAVGPWRPVSLQQVPTIAVDTASLRTSMADGSATVNVAIELSGAATAELQAATFSVAGQHYPLDIDSTGSGARLYGNIDAGALTPWWPHTHGEPTLHPATVSVKTTAGEQPIWTGALGFRQIEMDSDTQALRVNGTDVFARGGCWTCTDVVSLSADQATLRARLQAIRDAGANMIRIGGTMTYESDAFHRLCDELGLLVWQDLMFANMDYPADDEDFAAEVTAEVTQQLERLLQHPSTVVICGGSETEQQPAMFGMPADVCRNALFYERIPSLLDNCGNDLPWFASSPCEGALPFHNNVGIAHYFGVGAYQRPLDDVRLAGIRFASECLAFSNVPEDRSLRRHFGTQTPAVHTPEWKRGVPRDASAGWDFEDVRDHYIRELYGLDPIALRYSDNPRYLAISQVVTGEIMRHCYEQWRSSEDACQGALIWWLNDLVAGAGWGPLDVDGDRKPVWYYLRRAWGPATLSILDNGLDGLAARLSNETPDVLSGTLRVQLCNKRGVINADESMSVSVPANGTLHQSLDALLGRFYDTTWSYRFGPAGHEVVAVTFAAQPDSTPLIAAYFPQSRNLQTHDGSGLQISSVQQGTDATITIRSDRFVHGLKLTSTTHTFSDNFLDVPPDTELIVQANSLSGTEKPLRATVSALNLDHPRPLS